MEVRVFSTAPHRPMTGPGPRIVVIGNAGGGKSTLARGLSTHHHVPHHELDDITWDPGWVPIPPARYDDRHSRIIAEPAWVIDGLGRRASIPSRLSRATGIILIDLPLWSHCALAADRQLAWSRGELLHPPGGQRDPPPNAALFKTIHDVDRHWMPEIRILCADAERAAVPVTRLGSIHQLRRHAAALDARPYPAGSR